MTATAIKNDIKTASGLHNSTLIMFDTTASLSSAFKEPAQIQAALCRARAVFSYSGVPPGVTKRHRKMEGKEREGERGRGGLALQI